ncbi:MAG: hypothetical protein RMK00_02100 [Bacteroidota bacterium]|nr:hypothetical protein [Candidatus Kapabacteria bacterium]MCX7936832.1 hypothetical protein [Chlorobiota bacterium]MDW8074551.1 hypothetical protein [Bacteroidota bacterium]
MAKVLFSMTYVIDPENLEEYRELVRRLKAIYAEHGIDYHVFVGKNHEYTELTTYPSKENFDASEDTLLEREDYNEYITRINRLARDVRYVTLHELEL